MPGSWSGWPRTGSRTRLTALLAPPGDAPDLALQSKRLARPAPAKPTRIPAPQGVRCCSRQGLGAAPTPGTRSWTPTRSPGPCASRTPWAQHLLCARAARPSLAHPHPHPTRSGRQALPGLTCAGAVATASPSPGAAAVAAQGEEGSAGLLAQRPPGSWCCRAADPPRDINNII